MFYYIIIQGLSALVEGGKESKSSLLAFDLLFIRASEEMIKVRLFITPQFQRNPLDSTEIRFVGHVIIADDFILRFP